MIYRVEMRFDIQADSNEEAMALASQIAGNVEDIGGADCSVTGAWDENWDEVVG